MEAFSLERPGSLDQATAAARDAQACFIAGGTDLLQLMKNNVEAPRRLVDLDKLPLADVRVEQGALRLGALAVMADVAAHPLVRQGWPMISEALLLSASPQVRNMGTMGGNLLQRTRCGYFRDTGFGCNKRAPGSGCPAIEGENRDLAIFGGSPLCIATHPSDMPVALMALDASVELRAPEGGLRHVALADFYLRPGDHPERETVLRPGELVTAILVPGGEAARRSTYLKLRDRQSFAFALVSAAVGLDVQGGTIREARVAAGGVGVMPWRLPAVEAALRGGPADDATLARAAAKAGDGARPASQNGFKVTLLQRVVLRALQAMRG